MAKEQRSTDSSWIPSENTLEVIKRIQKLLAECEERLRASSVTCSIPGCGKNAPYSHSEGTYQIVLRVYVCPDGHKTFVR